MQGSERINKASVDLNPHEEYRLGPLWPVFYLPCWIALIVLWADAGQEVMGQPQLPFQHRGEFFGAGNSTDLLRCKQVATIPTGACSGDSSCRMGKKDVLSPSSPFPGDG